MDRTWVSEVTRGERAIHKQKTDFGRTAVFAHLSQELAKGEVGGPRFVQGTQQAVRSKTNHKKGDGDEKKNGDQMMMAFGEVLDKPFRR